MCVNLLRMNLNKELNLTPEKLGDLSPGDVAEIIGFCVGESTSVLSAESQVWQERFLNRLHEIGFLLGEKLEVLEHAPISRDPISVRIKNAVYAMRRSDANWVYVKRIIA